MNSNLKKDKYVAIIELSSTAIKPLLGMPQYIKRKPEALDRFVYYPIVPTLINTYIDKNGILNLNKFEKRLLPEISKIAKRLSKEPLQKVKIIFTGYYRTIDNFDKLLVLIKTCVTEYISHKKCEFELLSATNESYLSFLSWFQTLDTNGPTNSIDKTFFMFSQGLHIDIGGGSTEITIFKGDDFTNTISVPLGTVFFKNKILNERGVSTVVLNSYSEYIGEVFLDFLTTHFVVENDIKYCVSTGSFNWTNDFTFKDNNCYLHSIESLSNQIQNIRQNVAYIISYYLRNNEPIKRTHDTFIIEFIGLNILKTILHYLKVDKYYINEANLRIGAYYDLCEKIKDS